MLHIWSLIVDICYTIPMTVYRMLGFWWAFIVTVTHLLLVFMIVTLSIDLIETFFC